MESAITIDFGNEAGYCETCHSNITNILHSSSQPESVKSEQLREAKRHFDVAKQERKFYEECIKAKRSAHKQFSES